MEAETTGIIISTAVATKALDVALAWVKAKFAKNPQPFITEQTSYQAAMKANAKDHGDIFDRLRKCEANIATLMERTISQGKILDRMADQVGQLYDRIVMGKRK